MNCEDNMNDSILKTIRHMIGPSEDYSYFDTDLIVHINSAFSRLCQLGVGPENPFRITGEAELWQDFMDDGYQEDVKQFVYLNVRLYFDPPSNATVLTMYKDQIQKLEWLLMETAEHGY